MENAGAVPCSLAAVLVVRAESPFPFFFPNAPTPNPPNPPPRPTVGFNATCFDRTIPAATQFTASKCDGFGAMVISTVFRTEGFSVESLGTAPFPIPGRSSSPPNGTLTSARAPRWYRTSPTLNELLDSLRISVAIKPVNKT